jgi:3-deoxy-D-manno-octulosonate 8-phosphate phosphatase (KDO 8-P phosphatase)
MIEPADVPFIDDDMADRLAALTAIVFDFDGVFTDNTVRVDQNGLESVVCWRGDGLGLARVRDSGVRTLILSTETNPVVAIRAAKMETEYISGVADKAFALRGWASRHNLPLADVAYVGNDINDIAAFGCVGLPIAVADACLEVLPHVKFKTRTRGGYGAVREVCDVIAAVRVNARSPR